MKKVKKILACILIVLFLLSIGCSKNNSVNDVGNTNLSNDV